jgi:glucose-1-phosphate thymidylyltransferase
MKAVILCAGYATRLYPLTLNTPKALLDVNGKPLLSHIIENLSSISEIDKIYVVTNDKFYNHFSDWAKGNKTIEVINDNTKTNETRLGGVGDFALALDKIKDDDILIILGDNFFNLELKRFVDFFRLNKETAVALYDLKNKEDARKFGVLETEGSKIIGFEEKPQDPKSTLISTGAYIFPKEFIGNLKDYISSAKNKEGIGFMIQDFVVNQFNLNGFVFDEGWFDIGSLDDYKRLNEYLKNSQ